MKYLKLFESENESKGYSKIEKNEYSAIAVEYSKNHKEIGGITWIPLSGQEFKILNDMLSKHGYTLDIKYNNTIAICTKSSKEIGYIHQSDDEWFIFNVSSGFYKCDQVTGLMQCLMDNLVNFSVSRYFAPKKFESKVTDNGSYQQILTDDLHINSPSYPINPDQWKHIESILTLKNLRYEIYTYNDLSIRVRRKYDLGIIQVADEWFYVIKHYLSDKPYSQPSEYYKCDQLDGLIDCLKDIV